MLNFENWEWNEQKIDDFLSLRFSEDETRSLLLSLTPDRITLGIFQAFVQGMQAKALAIPDISLKTLDCCGTGGAGLPRFNTSTTAAFVMAAAGVPVVKFGNRAATSKSGSFDLLELLGIPINWPLEALPELLENSGLVFLYAPQVYSELSGFMTLRRALGVPTIFNSMGPLLNPLQPAYRLLGASSPIMQKMLADYLTQDPYTEHAWVLRASSGLDELVWDESNSIYDVTAGTRLYKELAPTLTLPQRERGHSESLNKKEFVPNSVAQNTIPVLSKSTIQNPVPSPSGGGLGWGDNMPHTPEENGVIFNAIVSGEDQDSSHFENVCLNAGAGIYIAGRVESLESGIQLAKELLQTGQVRDKLHQVQSAYNQKFYKKWSR